MSALIMGMMVGIKSIEFIQKFIIFPFVYLVGKMTKVTVEEPKTVVEEEVKYECENCGMHFDEGEVVEVVYRSAGSEVNVLEEENRHLCDGCSDIREAHQSIQKKRDVVDYVVDKLKKWSALRTLVTAASGFLFGVWMFWSIAVVELHTEELPEQFFEVFVVEATFGVIGFSFFFGISLVIGIAIKHLVAK
jgi:hypothetical protein